MGEGRPHSRARPGRTDTGKRVETPVPRGNTQHLEKTFEQGSFIVFDIESTGGNPERNGITEIFGLRYKRGKVEDTFYAMVNPEVSIPPIVRKMTGITNQMVRDAPPIKAIMPGFVEFVGNDVLVSHNTIGDMKFLRYFSEQVCGTPMPNYFMCTHLLVEKLVQEAPDKSLKGLSLYFDLHHEGGFHRAEGDAYLTLGLFKTLLEKLKLKGITTIAQGIRFQGDYESGTRLGWGVDPQALANIPNEPGVLFLKDHGDRVTFVVGTPDIAREVKKLQRLDMLPRPLLKTVFSSSGIGFETTRSSFEASLLEAAEVDKHRVKFDPSQWHHRSAKFLFLAVQEDGAWLLVNGPLTDGAVGAVGPVMNGREAAEFVDAVGAAFSLKVGRKGLVLTNDQGQAVARLLRGQQANGLWARIRGLLGASVPGTKSLERLKGLQVPQGLRSIDDVNGLIVVPVGKDYIAHTVVGGLPEGVLAAGEDPRAWLVEERENIAKRIAGKIKSRQAAPLSLFEALTANRVVWWASSGVKREGGKFISLEDLQAGRLPTD